MQTTQLSSVRYQQKLPETFFVSVQKNAVSNSMLALPADQVYFSSRKVEKKKTASSGQQPDLIRFDYSNVSSKQIGQKEGINIQAAFDVYKKEIARTVTKLYESKNKKGSMAGWLSLGYDEDLVNRIHNYAQSVRGKYQDIVVLGIGGSSLGGYALLKALLEPGWNELSDELRGGYPRYRFIQNVDADQIRSIFRGLNPEKTLFVTITKSGTTMETMGAFMIATKWLLDNLGPAKVKEHIVAVTDAKKGDLRDIVNRYGYQSFEIPEEVGGRFSVFSAVGLLPAALCGIPIEKIQQGVRDMDARLQNTDIRKNAAAQNALIHYLMYRKKENDISVFMPFSHRLRTVADWYGQLWDESLGKKHNRAGKVAYEGTTAVPAEGVTDQHSKGQLMNGGKRNKITTFVEVEKPDHDVVIPATVYSDIKGLDYLRGVTMGTMMGVEFTGARDSLTQNKRPQVTFTLPAVTPYHLAQLMYLLEVQTAITGEMMDVNWGDQPGVNLYKLYAIEALKRRK